MSWVNTTACGVGMWDVWRPLAESKCPVESDTDEFEDTGTPWPKLHYTRTVTLKENQLWCSCMYTQSVLVACRHIIAVKRGNVTARDCHYRYSSIWQAGLVPLEKLSRSFDDLKFGVPFDGVERDPAGALLSLYTLDMNHDHSVVFVIV